MKQSKSETIISTARLNLRTWLAEDASAMAAISADSEVMRYFPTVQDLAATQQLINRACEQYAHYGYSLYAVEIKESQEFIGFVGLSHPSYEIPHFLPKNLPIVEIGWRLAKEQWNKGYATEAAQAVLDYAFTELELGELISFTVKDNYASRRIMEKIGLTHNPADDFDHPRIDKSNPCCEHALYRLNRDEYLSK